MAATLWPVSSVNGFSTTLNGAITDSDTSIILTSVTGLSTTGGILVIDRVNSAGTETSSTREYVSYTAISTKTLTGCTRGVASSTDQAHSSGAVVEEVWSVTHILDLITFLGVSHDSGGSTLCPGWTAASDAATVTFDLDSGANTKHSVTLGGNRTLALSNVRAGQVFILRLLQDATGSRTVTWFDTIKWSNGPAPTLTTTASKADVYGFIQTDTNKYDGFVVGANV